ncbi:DUF5131 family protein [Nonomuraea sp. NPDC023979]|uniref:DUF5131 family protein n=1 Tax=Nonomuraea sp. NPDC023979 TaxID=3154796 RepID=UPI0033FFBFA2
MAERTSIGWTDLTWNPWTHRCTPITEECDLCYAHTDTKRWQGANAFTSEPPTLLPDRLLMPLLSGPYRVGGQMFTASMTDPFHPGVPVEDIALVWAVMAATTMWEHQTLSKRHTRMYRILSDPGFPQLVRAAFERLAAMIKTKGALSPNRRRALAELEQAADRFVYPVPNILVGVSAGTQKWVDRRLPRLAATPATARFASVEPMLTSADLTPWLHALDWVIVGGESGGGARPFEEAWARDIIAQCRDAGVAVFVKQMGSRWASATRIDGRTVRGLKDPKGEKWEFWPEDLRVRQFPVLTGVAA